MGRKRLLTILAAVTAAVSLQVGTASAQTVNDVTVEAGECLEVGVDISLTDALKLDPSVCVEDDGVRIEGGASAGGTTVDAGEATKPVQETTKKVTESVKSGGSKTPAPKPDPDPTTAPKPSEPTKPSNGGNDGGTSSSGSNGSGGDSSSREVATSGNDAQERRSARDRNSLRELGALQAIRSDMAADSPLGLGVAGPVETFGGLGTTDDLAAPLVADGLAPGVDERLTPEVAPAAPDQQEAVLATSSPLEGIPEAPVALQLLAAALVLGAATVWTIASRELGTGNTSSA